MARVCRDFLRLSGIWSNPPVEVESSTSRLTRTISSLVLNISKYGYSSVSLYILFQCWATLTITVFLVFIWNTTNFVLCPLTPVLSWAPLRETGSFFPSHQWVKYIKILPGFLFSWLNSPSSQLLPQFLYHLPFAELHCLDFLTCHN